MSRDGPMCVYRSVPVAVVGSGNIGTDLMEKLRSSATLDLRWVVGVDPDSEGLARARAHGIAASAGGVDWLLAQAELPVIVFEATSAQVHAAHARRYEAAGVIAVDLTPAAVGPFVVPPVNLAEHAGGPNLNLVTCGGQATIPLVHAVRRVVDVRYAEIVATIGSRSAGPGTRANIDAFTRTTARAIETVTGVTRAKAIIILNPADPPLIMRDTVMCTIPRDADRDRISASLTDMVRAVQAYVPGYRLCEAPQFDDGRVTVLVEVEGAGDYLPAWAGNLDIMTAAAVRVGEMLAEHLVVAP